MTLKEFKEILKKFDFNYYKSLDPKIYWQGERGEQWIRETAQKLGKRAENAYKEAKQGE